MIDQNLLSRNYKELQKIVHPDKYGLNNKEILLEAEICSSMISNAYNILKDDFERANYMVQLKLYIQLKLKGMKNIEEGSENVNDNEYLEILMDIQDDIQYSTSEDELNKIKNKILAKITEIKLKIENCFESNKLEEVYEQLKLMKFYLSLLNQAENRQI